MRLLSRGAAGGAGREGGERSSRGAWRTRESHPGEPAQAHRRQRQDKGQRLRGWLLGEKVIETRSVRNAGKETLAIRAGQTHLGRQGHGRGRHLRSFKSAASETWKVQII